MKKVFLFFAIALLLGSCAGTPKVPESNLVEKTNDEDTATPVETTTVPIPKKEQEIESESALAVLPVEAEEVIKEAIIEEVETTELAKETSPEPVINEPEVPVLAELLAVEEEYVEPIVVPQTVSDVVLEIKLGVLPEAVAEAIPEVVQKVTPEVIQNVIQEAIPETVTVASQPLPTETIPPIVATPPVPTVPPPASPIPEPASPQISQAPVLAEVVEPPAVVPPAPSFVPPASLPALSGQYEERELLPGSFSRTVHAVTGQLIEIPFSGNGWLYLGEAESRRGIAYESRRVDPEGQSFIFRADTAGVYALKFYRQDFVRNFILNDQVQVIVSDAISGVASNRTRVIAEPRWPSPAEEAQALRSNSRPASPESSTTPGTAVVDNSAVARTTTTQPTVPTTTTQPVVTAATTQPSQPERTSAIPISPPNEGVALVQPPAPTIEVSATPSMPSTPPPLAADEYLKQAKDEFDATRIAQAISLLDQFSEHYPPERTLLSDELYWLYGQFYEANSPSRNILLSLDYYRRLINEYPQSSRCNDARRRISYLERYFINNR